MTASAWDITAVPTHLLVASMASSDPETAERIRVELARRTATITI